MFFVIGPGTHVFAVTVDMNRIIRQIETTGSAFHPMRGVIVLFPLFVMGRDV